MELKTSTTILATQLENFPADANPYHWDSENMGQEVGKDLHMMYGNHSHKECNYLIFIQKSTGKRFKIEPGEIFKAMPNLTREDHPDLLEEKVRENIQKKVRSITEEAIAAEISKVMVINSLPYPEARRYVLAAIEA